MAVAVPRKEPKILGISAYYHDSAAVLLSGGRIIAAAQEERFTRKKHDESFPKEAIRYVLGEAGVRVKDLDAIVFYDKPYLKFERLLETYHAFVPRGIRSFLTAMPVWVSQKIYTRTLIWIALTEIAGGVLERKPPLLFSEHHLSHAASAFYPSPFSSAAILTVDGVGEWSTTSIGKGSGAQIEIMREMHFPHSIGLFYSAGTVYCGFKVNSGEYKLMGLAPYGRKGSPEVARFKSQILTELLSLKEDGSVALNMEHYHFAVGLTMCNEVSWERVLSVPPRKPETPLTQVYMDLALAIQEITEEAMMRLARTARALTGEKQLVMAGGVALNCVANGLLRKKKVFEDVWVQPAAGDAGGALGGALAAHYLYFEGSREKADGFDAMQGSYLGPSYCRNDIERVIRTFDAPAEYFASFDTLAEDIAEKLSRGLVVGWFQGRMEWGPRALGNRSILADPRNPDMQKKLNLKIKYREGFRPFAPSVRVEDMTEYFEGESPDPYMLFTVPVVAHRRKPLAHPATPLVERLYTPRSDIPAVTHLDYSARVQTVSRATNERYWKLLTAFKERTGYGLLINTSFNVRGEPIVMTPKDAYGCFMNTEMDYLVMGDFLFDKRSQPAWRRTHVYGND
jgi:carbamoyltransferase